MYVPGAAQYPRILTYHEVSRRFHLGINNVSPNSFRKQIEFIKESGLKFAKLKGLRDSSGKDKICITFDDGYQSFYDEVFPTLIEEKIPATLFIITDYIGRTNDWDITFGINRRRHLNWDMIREISDQGIEIGSHSRTHRDLTRISSETAHSDLLESKTVLEEGLGREVTSLALPFGAASFDLITIARQCGYQEICGGVPGIKGPFSGVLPRFPVYRWDRNKALIHKLEMNLFEITRLGALHACSNVTRVMKTK
ncbi:hypothetical protein CEE37_03740 [candidate division LCP-89 bacterium B3_LCP]|uniref:NodB homology domain-containing protein n=1 Tax=candidate division LCP-89 bacterium B3_LCP TaxID=2012998 RepID=A0A532V3G8_UNCL8|nr:MAG: hypothetical protein CEE37_03740 [candidate division LCP-89 bacterium B3_LCP]